MHRPANCNSISDATKVADATKWDTLTNRFHAVQITLFFCLVATSCTRRMRSTGYSVLLLLPYVVSVVALDVTDIMPQLRNKDFPSWAKHIAGPLVSTSLLAQVLMQYAIPTGECTLAATIRKALTPTLQPLSSFLLFCPRRMMALKLPPSRRRPPKLPPKPSSPAPATCAAPCPQRLNRDGASSDTMCAQVLSPRLPRCRARVSLQPHPSSFQRHCPNRRHNPCPRHRLRPHIWLPPAGAPPAHISIH